MYVNGLFISTILIGSLFIFIMLFSGRNNLKINFYLLLLLIQLILHRVFILVFSSNLGDVNISQNYPAILSIIFLPCWYLYIRTLLIGKINFKHDLYHFIIPSIVLLANLILYKTPFIINLSVGFLLGLYYIIITLKFIKIKTNNFLLNDKFLNWWVYTLYGVFVSIYFSILILKFSSGINSDQWLMDFYIITSILWLLLLVFIFLNPIILYGKVGLIQNIIKQENNIDIWNLNAIKQVKRKDQYIQKIIQKNIPDLIYKIISFQGNDKLTKEHDFSVSFIASQISTPKSHVVYLLNYHCKYQGSDYINLVKVLKSMRFIKAGYLEHKTIESLSLECGFNSRITFFNNFKKFNGISPKEFAKKVVT